MMIASELSYEKKLLSFECNVIDLSRSSGYDITNYKKINQYLTKFSEIDILINCAGYIVREGSRWRINKKFKKNLRTSR